MKKRMKNERKRSRMRVRTRFAGLFERLEERLPLTGPYVNAPISQSQANFFVEGAQGLSSLGERIDRSGDFSQPLGPFKNRDGTPVTPGLLGPYGRTLQEQLENPIGDYFDSTPVSGRTTDSLIAHLGSDPAFLSIEGGFVDGTIDELVFEIHIQRQYELNLLDIEFENSALPFPFQSKSGIEANLTAIVDFQVVFGIVLDPSLNAEQSFFIRDLAIFSSIRADTIFQPFKVNLGVLEASVPDVVLAASVDIEVSQPPSTPSLSLTEINTLEVAELFASQIGLNDFDAKFNLDVGIGRWRLSGLTYLQAVGDFLGFDPVISYSPNFDEVFLFNNITSAEIVAGMENFQAWLMSWSNSSQYDIAIPFTKDTTAGSVFNAGNAMSGFIRSLRDEQGNPAFDNVGDFPYSGSGIDYNEATNKLQLVVLRNLPSQQTQSRVTRVELDDTVGLSSQSEAVVTGDGTVSFVISIDLSQENVNFLDRIAIEDLRIQTFYGTEAVVLTGNAAFGGLGLAFANGILSGDFSASAVFKSLRNGLPVTLRVLNDTIDIAHELLQSEMAWNGTSSLRLPSLQVAGNLFGLAPNSFIEVSISNIKNSVYTTTTNVSDFWNFSSMTFEGLTQSFSDALLGTQAWDSEGDEAVATLGVSLQDFGPLKQDRIAQAVAEAVKEADTAAGYSRLIVQDLPGFAENLVLATTSGVSQFVSNLSYHVERGALEWFVDVTAEEATSVSIGLGFESLFGLTSDPMVDDTENLVGEGASLPVSSTSRLQLGLEFDPAEGNQSQSLQNGFLNSRSRLDRTIYANATSAGGNPISLQGTSGALAMKLQNGSLVIAQSIQSPSASAPAVFSSSIPANGGRVRISELPVYVPQRQSQGQLLADFEVVPDHTGTAEGNRLHFETLNFASLASTTSVLSSPDFPQLRRSVDLQVNLNAFLPAIEEMLKQIEARIIDEVLDRAYPLIGEQLDQFANFIAPFREAINNALERLNSFTPSAIETAIEDALRNLFNRPQGDFVRVEIKTPTVFKLTLDIDNAPISVTKPVNSNLGLPALGADWTADFSVVGAYQFQMTFVLDLKDGFYIETNTETVEMTLDVDMFGQATGKLGFFEIVATADAPAAGKSVFHAEYVIDVTEPSGDNRLFLTEIGTGPLVDTNQSGLSGEAHMRFSIEALVNDWLPSLETGLRIDWEFDGIGFQGRNPPVVTYEGIELNLGRLLSEVFLPFFETIQDVFQPMQPIIDIFTSPLPVLSDLLDPDPSILSLATAVKDLMPEDIRRGIESLVEFIEMIETIEGLVLAIQRDKASSLSLQLGSIKFGGATQPQFDARLDSLDAAVLDLASTRGDLRTQFDGANGAPNVAAELNRSPGVLHLPMIENPRNAIGWILGIDEAELITWDLPNASFSFPVGFEFPVLPGILAGIFGGLEVGFDFKVGLDTAGFEAYSRTRDMKDFFQGFYVSDRANADGTGKDINEVFLRGDLLAAAGLGVPGVALQIGGGIFTEVGIDLLDHDRDGKVRGRDFSSGDGCFALRGEFGVALEAEAKVGPLRLELPLAEATLARGRKVIGCPFYEPPPPAVLAGLNSATGTLTLFMGPEAHRRDVRPNAEEEAFTVKESAGEIVVLAFGKSQSFDATQVRNIVADGGTKDDRISLVGVNKPSILRGGDGDDVLNGGERIDFIDGGAGNDEIFGWGDKDTLVGGDGLDLIFGNDGDDDLYGGEGDDELDGGEGDDKIYTGNGRNIAYGDAGNDEIYGGSQRDVIYGGAGDDTIEGNDGPDVLSGDSGIDAIYGQLGDDLIDGGDDGDFLFGEEGKDRLYGRRGVDEIDGGEDSDILSGNEDGDFLYGRDGADEIFGDEGDDTIDSGDGPDLIYGGDGSDTIDSGAGEDTIYGGDGSDTVDGGEGDDTIYGEGLNDTLSGGAGDDTIFGGLGSDTIYGYVRDLLADSLPLGATDRDKLYGERGADRIAGGPHDDFIYGQEDSDQLVGNEGSDKIEGGSGADSIYGFHLIVPAFWCPVTGGSDLAGFLYGNGDNDLLYGGPADDLMRGNDGDDEIYGQEGSDRVFGDHGNDTIDGGDGADTIDGGLGNDHIIGGNAADSLFGNRGMDVIEGNVGDDFIAGNDHDDLIYGDEGKDSIRGGSGNDTLRGGDDNDTIYGEDGDDLIIGYRGSDTIYGDAGNDVIYGGDQTDNVQGGIGNDRIYGERGDDTLDGNEGDDVIEGGAGSDTISGNDGADALYGDGGEDTIHGGPGNDFLFAGEGVSNVLNGDEGNDLLVGSDDGDEDPKFGDLTYFGDRLSGGDGDDIILGLGGADVIDGGSGTNTIDGGTHTDQVTHGTDTPGVANFQMPTGPDRRGRWSELSRSASLGGLSDIGGYEEAVYVDQSGIYIAWVDWRNGNSEIYVAFHPHGVGDWTPLVGFGAFDSASGGGISNDANQSRRPTLFKTEGDDSLIVAWTSIAADGTSTIEVAREDNQWARIPNPAQTGAADDSKFIQFSSHSGLLFWGDTNPNTNAKGLRVAQYVRSQGCFHGFLQPRSVYPIPAGKEFEDYDAAAVEFQGVVAISYGDSSDRDIAVMVNTTSLENEATFCPSVPNVSFQEYVTEGWLTAHTVTDGNTLQPTIGIQYIDQRGQVPGEIELEFDIGVAWELVSSRENQVDGLVVQVRLDEPVSVQPMVPLYDGDTRARIYATTISDTIGYADKPNLAMSYGSTYLGWRDDGVFETDGRSSIFVLSRYRDPALGDYILSEEVRGDASGFGISSTGGSLRDFELTTAEDGFISSLPVLLWNEAREPYVPVSNGTIFEGTSVYLRVMLPGLQAVDDREGLRKFGRFQGNILSNDLYINGEFEGIVSRFDRFELIRGETESITFTSPLGALVIVELNGNVSYDPNGAPAFRQLKRDESVKELFIYRVNNGIHEAEATIEFIVTGNNLWRNGRNHFDVDDDRSISPLDVLTLINDLNTKGSRKLDDIGPNSKQFLDVDDDGSVSPLDVLLLINWINSQSSGNGEGEGDFSESEVTDTRWLETEWVLIAGVSSDLWMDWQSKQRRLSKRGLMD